MPHPLRGVALVLVAACAAAPGSTPVLDEPSTTTTTTIPVQEASLRFTGCLRDQGLQVPDLELGPDGRLDLAALEQSVDLGSSAPALRACAGLLLEAGALDLTAVPELATAVRDELVRFAGCMRRQGLSGFPDPVPDFAGVGPAFPPEEVPFDDVGYEAAFASCWATIQSGE